MGTIIDPIADMLTRIRNANQRKQAEVSIPHSKQKLKIAEILKKEGFIVEYKLEGKAPKQNMIVTLKYKGTERVITGIKRISKPSLRVYSPATDIPYVLSGFGIAIISTSKGMITDKEARKANEGGEIIAYVW